MTYYNQEFLRIRKQHFPKPYITDHLSKARSFINENVSISIDLQTISEFSFLSKFHFSRLFKKSYGVTPHKYLTEQRIELAKKLLMANKSVIDTCFYLGFESPNSFSATFKKYTALSPSDYKKQFSIRSSEKTSPLL